MDLGRHQNVGSRSNAEDTSATDGICRSWESTTERAWLIGDAGKWIYVRAGLQTMSFLDRNHSCIQWQIKLAEVRATFEE